MAEITKSLNKKGRFITLDGTEGAGKTTQLAYIREWCQKEGIEAIFSREPGGTPFSEKVRHLLLDSSSNIPAISELLLVLAARRDHIEKVIYPALMQGKWIISDRFSDSTYAYQHYGRKIPLEILRELEKLSQTDLKPDLRFILGISVEKSKERLMMRGTTLNRFENENDDFFYRVSQGYQACTKTGAIWIDCENELPKNIFIKIKNHLEKLK